MKTKRCEVCGCIMYDTTDSTICDIREEDADGD